MRNCFLRAKFLSAKRKEKDIEKDILISRENREVMRELCKT